MHGERNRRIPTAEELRTVYRMVDEARRAGKPAPHSATFDSGRTVTAKQAEIFAALETKVAENKRRDTWRRASTGRSIHTHVGAGR